MSPDSSESGKVLHELIENHFCFFLLALFTMYYSLGKLLTIFNTRYLCHLDVILSVTGTFLPSSSQALRPKSRSFAQIQDKINSILCCVLTEMYLFILNTICLRLAMLFFLFLSKRRIRVSS